MVRYEIVEHREAPRFVIIDHAKLEEIRSVWLRRNEEYHVAACTTREAAEAALRLLSL